jgi:hypothetical protein
MPGKYPTINSPLTTRTTLTPGGTTGISNSDKASLGAMFPNSPIYTMNETDYRTLAASYLQPARQEETGRAYPDFPEYSAGVDMNYSDAPDLSTPPTGFDSSYYPNLLAFPDPAGGEGAPTGHPLSPNDNFGTGATANNVLPSATSELISAQTIDVTGPIAQPGDSGTHDINPGATGQPAA